MAVYEIRPGTPFAFDEVDKVTIVGAGAIWADDDNATYASSHSVHHPYLAQTVSGIIAAPLPAVPAEVVNAIDGPMGFLAVASVANTEGMARQVTFYVSTLDGFPYAGGSASPMVPPDTITTLDYASWNALTIGTAADALIAGTAHLFFHGPGVTDMTDTADGTLYDFTLRINYTPSTLTAAPPCQISPRDDDQGAGTAAIWPPSSSGMPGGYY